MREVRLPRKWWSLVLVSLFSVPIAVVALANAWPIAQALLLRQSLPDDQSPWLVALVTLALFVLAAAFYWIPLQTLLANLSDNGLEQPSLLGRKVIPWSEVTKVEGHSFNLSVRSRRHAITLNLYLFEDQGRVVAEVQRRVPPSAVLDC